MAHLVMDGSEISGCRDQNGENDMFTGGDELAMRMMIARWVQKIPSQAVAQGVARKQTGLRISNTHA